jgi:hypothetical protein
MKLFKNFKTKRQLREEIAELKGMLCPQRPQIHTIDREIQKVSSDIVFDNNESIEHIKEQIAHGMVEFLKPLIEWDIEDDKTNPFKKRIRGNIYLAKKK